MSGVDAGRGFAGHQPVGEGVMTVVTKMPKCLKRAFAAAVLVCCLAPLAVRADDPVRLKVAYGQNYAVSGMTQSWTTIEAHVQNIAYEKSVFMYYKDPADQAWKEFPLPFKGHYGNYDVFGGVNAPASAQFVLRFTVPGATYWDNNNGTDYTIGTFRGRVGGSVMLKQATARIGSEAGGGFVFTTSWLEAEVYVANLSYNKRVAIRYSADGGITWADAAGSYAGKVQAVASTVDDVEIWKIKTPTYNLNTAAPAFRFSIFYEQRDPGADFGKTWWDNNFGQDYSLGKLDGTTIR